MKHRLHPLLHPYLTKGQGAGGDGAVGETASEQSLGIVLFLCRRHGLDHPLVASQLNVTAEQGIGHPQDGIEPVHRQNEESQGLPQVIPTGKVGSLVGQHRHSGGVGQGRGQVNPGTEDAQNEGGVDPVAEHDLGLGFNRHPDPTVDTQITDKGIYSHEDHASDPYPRCHRPEYLHGVDALPESGGEVFLDDGVEGVVHHGDAAMNGRDLVGENGGGHGLSAGDKAPGAFYGKWQNQPQSHQCPQNTQKPLGHSGALQHRSQKHDRQGDPGGGDAHVE